MVSDEAMNTPGHSCFCPGEIQEGVMIMENLQAIWKRLDGECNELSKVSGILYAVDTILMEMDDTREVSSAHACLELASEKMNLALKNLRGEQERISRLLHPEGRA